MYRHKWSLFPACACIGTTCSLCKRVCPYQLASSSDVFGSFFFPCRWNLWVKLTTAGWVYNSYTTVLTDFKGVSSHSPFLQCCPGGMNHSSSWMRKFLGVQMLTSSSLITFPKCLGKLEGQRLSIWLKHSLDGLLHQTRAIRGVCYSQHNALFPHSSTPPVLPWRATTLEGVS